MDAVTRRSSARYYRYCRQHQLQQQQFFADGGALYLLHMVHKVLHSI